MKNGSKDFFQRVYNVVEKIPRGKVATYGQIAMILGSPLASRVVGYAMSHAPEYRGLPCHRVVNRKGELAAEDVFGGQENQRRLLKAEGVFFTENGLIDLKRSIWNYSDEGNI